MTAKRMKMDNRGYLALISALIVIVTSACDDDSSSEKETGTSGSGGSLSSTDASQGEGDAKDNGNSDSATQASTGDGNVSGSGGSDSATGEGGSGGTGTPEGGTGGTGPSGECVDGCVCELEQVCDYICGTNCAVECLGGYCTTECPEGGCTMDADFRANANYSCSGGGCETDCDNESICAVDCPGGGCNVVCDAGSTCTVSCSGGDPCVLTCESGGRGQCQDENCTTVGCDATCEPDPSYQPLIDPVDFTTVVDNPLFILPIGAEWVFDAPDEVITVTVTDQTQTVMGVSVVVVHDEVRTPEGELIEDTYDWYAQDSEGNVWYFGEETAEYVNGQLATTAGSWEAGLDGALPGIIMKASPAVGDIYRQEYFACEAEDMGEVMATGESETVPTGNYSDCVRIRDFSPLEPTANEIKTFCPGLGVILVIDVATGERVEELTSISMP